MMTTYPITVQTKPVGNHRSKSRTYDAQILEFGEITRFYIMSKTSREIWIDDHFKINDIIKITYNGHIYQPTEIGTEQMVRKQVPRICATLIA